MKPFQKRVTALALLVSMLGLASISWLFPEKPRRRYIAWLLQRHSRSLLEILGIKVKVIGKIPEGHYLIVANHLSYLDIPLLASVFTALFITSQDMAETFVLGTAIRLTDCMTVDRRKFTTLLFDIKELSCRLNDGLSIVLFPEATTSSGTTLPFHSALIDCAAHAGVPVLPVVIRYLGLTKDNKNTVYYYGNAEFFSHLGQLAHRPSLDVEVEILPAVNVKNRKEAASYLHKIISEKTIPL